MFLCVLCGEKSDAQAFDARAVSLLGRMAAAYSRLRVFDQRTEFSAELIPFDLPDSPFGIPKQPTDKAQKQPDTESKTKIGEADGAERDKDKPQNQNRKLRLRYAFPNRLRLEMEEAEPGRDKPLRYLWDSDGKFFWTTIPDKNWYTRDKAPARITEFRKLTRLNANSLEMLMLLGVNPFANVREQCDRLTWEGAATAGEVSVDVVALWTDSRMGDTVAKLYIGHDDLLLRRVVIETTPAVGPTTPGKIGDALDDLALDDPNAAPAPMDESGAAPPLLDAPLPPAPLAGAKPTKTRITYNNLINPNPTFEFNTFAFVVPADAMRFGVDTASLGNIPKPLDLMRRSKSRKKNRVIKIK